jgi:hypothetical protein
VRLKRKKEKVGSQFQTFTFTFTFAKPSRPLTQAVPTRKSIEQKTKNG